jgi:carbonic anhydrase/acetyltransferase-like protein (isoleucine patch superfamily)
MNSITDSTTYRFMQANPKVGERVYIADSAHVSGSVVLEDDVSIWPMAVIRGDVNSIHIGSRTNIQDGSVLHVTHEFSGAPDGIPLLLGADITVGHRAVLHACEIDDRCLVGMGAIVMDGARVESDCMIAAGAVVTPGTRLPRGTLWKGSPARYARDLTEEEVRHLEYSARHYVRLKDRYLERDG